MPSFVLRPSLPPGSSAFCSPSAAATGYAIVLAVRNDPPADCLAAGIAIILAFDALASPAL